jgi:hypothetical protein
LKQRYFFRSLSTDHGSKAQVRAEAASSIRRIGGADSSFS